MHTNAVFATTVACFIVKTGIPDTVFSVDALRIDVKIDRPVTVVLPDSALKRAMLGMVRHLDRAIFKNLPVTPVVLTSRKTGRTGPACR